MILLKKIYIIIHIYIILQLIKVILDTTDPTLKEYLFTKRVDINAVNDEGDTALHVLCKEGGSKYGCRNLFQS